MQPATNKTQPNTPQQNAQTNNANQRRNEKAWLPVYFLVSASWATALMFHHYSAKLIASVAAGKQLAPIHISKTAIIFAIITIATAATIISAIANKPKNGKIKAILKTTCTIAFGFAFGLSSSLIRINSKGINQPAAFSYQRNAAISGTVTEVRKIGTKGNILTLTNLNINGKPSGSGNFFCKKACSKIIIGDQIKFTGNASPLSYKEYNSKTNLLFHQITKPPVRGFVKTNNNKGTRPQANQNSKSEEPPAKQATPAKPKLYKLQITKSGNRLSPQNIFLAARLKIEDRIRKSKGNQNGKGLMLTITTGNQSFVGNNNLESMRASGLAHLLAISGLHITIITSFVFLIIRKGLAIFYRRSQHFNTKKLAASAAMVFGLFYLMLANAPISAIRSFLSFAIAMLAIIIDSRIIPLRIWSLVAIAVTTISPEKLFTASFQMSFLATFALINTFGTEYTLKTNQKILNNSLPAKPNGKANGKTKASVLQSIVNKINALAKTPKGKTATSTNGRQRQSQTNSTQGGNSTKPTKFSNTIKFLQKNGLKIKRKIKSILKISIGIAGQTLKGSAAVTIFLSLLEIYHFGYISLGGMVANLVAIPIVEFIVLPASFVGVLLGGTGADLIINQLTSYPAGLVVKISHIVANLPLSQIHIGSISGTAAITIITALVIGSRANKTSLALALPIMAIGIASIKTTKPNLIIAGGGAVYKPINQSGYTQIGTQHKELSSRIASQLGRTSGTKSHQANLAPYISCYKATKGEGGEGGKANGEPNKRKASTRKPTPSHNKTVNKAQNKINALCQYQIGTNAWVIAKTTLNPTNETDAKVIKQQNAQQAINLTQENAKAIKSRQIAIKHPPTSKIQIILHNKTTSQTTTQQASTNQSGKSYAKNIITILPVNNFDVAEIYQIKNKNAHKSQGNDSPTIVVKYYFSVPIKRSSKGRTKNKPSGVKKPNSKKANTTIHKTEVD